MAREQGVDDRLGLVTGGNVDAVLAQYRNGGELVVASFGLTAGIFFALSAYAMNTKRDFSGWFAFLAVGTIAVIGAFIPTNRFFSPGYLVFPVYLHAGLPQ